MSTEMSASSQRLLLSAGRECFISLISHPRATGSRDLHHTRDPADPTNPRPPREALADHVKRQRRDIYQPGATAGSPASALARWGANAPGKPASQAPSALPKAGVKPQAKRPNCLPRCHPKNIRAKRTAPATRSLPPSARSLTKKEARPKVAPLSSTNNDYF
jgi:hypothetical protein